MNSTEVVAEDDDAKFRWLYVLCEVLVAIFAIVGNAMVIIVFKRERRLRRRTNYYIVSLAIADFLVGILGIPFAIMASYGLPPNLYACLFTVSLLVVLCTVSIFCLVAVSVDRYWAILHPMGYSRNVRTKTALVIISVCWMAGTIIGLLPLFGWNKGSATDGCYFMKVMDDYYLVFLYFGTIITPAFILFAFYTHIYRVILKQLRNIVTMNPENGTSTSGSTSGGTMLRMLGAQQKKEVKATQNLSIIVLFFMICWIPLYTINCVLAFCSTCKIPTIYMYPFIILSHFNSACNPLLYAYHLKDFRAALKLLLYNIFRIEYSVQVSYNGRPSIASNNAFSNNSHYCRSVNERCNSTMLTNSSYHIRALAGKRMSQIRGISGQNSSNISSLVPKSITLAAATASTGDRNREIWKLSDIPSISGDSDYDNNRMTAYKENSGSDQSANVNSAFLNGSNFDIISDDVFMDETSPITTRPFELDAISDNCANNNRVSKTVIRLPGISKNSLRDCLSTSSPQLSKNVFIVETDLPQPRTKDKRKFVRSYSEVAKETNRRALKFSLSGDFMCSPNKSLKLSPFKAAESCLLNKHSDTSSDDNTSLRSSKDRSNRSIYNFDNQSFSS